MKEKIFASFKSLKPNQKGIVVLLGIGVVLTLVGLIAYFGDSKSAKTLKQQTSTSKSSVISMDTKLLEKNQLLEAQKGETVAKEELEALKKQLEDQKKLEVAVNAGLVPPPAKEGSAPLFGGGGQKRGPSMPPMPPPAQRPGAPVLPPPPMPMQQAKGGGGNFPPPPVGAAAPMPSGVDSEIGGIAMVENPKSDQAKSAAKEDKKKEESQSVLLPISYMEATLLSGLDAPTSGDAKGNPVPVLIRVKTPAVLPNDVKANLRGCFVVADGKGNLGTERAELVLVSLSCIDRKGQAVIDQNLTGYVVDADGKAGLRGRVVTKMGSMIVRSAIAGMFGGVGDALNDASTTTSFSALGNVSQINPNEVAMAGVGSGISNAFKEIQKFYMELARQTMPVIEIGAARPVTLVLTRSTELHIKKIKGGKSKR